MKPKKLKAVHFGAGNIGRGLIAQMYQENEVEFTFVDRNPNNLNFFNTFKKYQIRFFDKSPSIWIDKFNFVNGEDEKEVIELLLEADIISTSIGSNNLIYIKDLVEKALSESANAKTIIAFENGFRISSAFKKMFGENVANRHYFVDTVVDRIVPIQDNIDWSLSTESFFEISLDSKQWNQNITLFKGVNYTTNLDAYIKRKLLLVNSVHTLIGLMGNKRNLKYINETLNDEIILFTLKDFQKQIIDAMVLEYDEFNRDELEVYSDKFIARINEPVLQDTNDRVIRNPITKLNKDERYQIALDITTKHHLKFNSILLPFYFLANLNFSNDRESMILQKDISEIGLKDTLIKHTGLSPIIVDEIIKEGTKYDRYKQY